MLMDCLNIENVSVVEFALWYLREKGYIEVGERNFMITAQGVDYLTEQLSKTQILGGAMHRGKNKGTVRASNHFLNQLAKPVLNERRCHCDNPCFAIACL